MNRNHMSPLERFFYLIGAGVTAFYFDVWDLGRVRRMTRKKDTA